jgi:D-arabinose 1-dehydrogenase-like Zn-dependent alcohol dehydrogenase
MSSMKVVQVPRPGADFEIVEREIPQPGPGHVRIRVQVCGVCHSDVITKERRKERRKAVGGEFQIALILGSLWRDSIYPITKM